MRPAPCVIVTRTSSSPCCATRRRAARTPPTRDAAGSVESEHDNLRAAFDHLVHTGDTARAADLAFGAWRFWQMRGHLIEGRARLDVLLALPDWPVEPSPARLRALEAAGGLAYWAGDTAAANRFYASAVAAARELGDQGQLANALYNQFFARRVADSLDDWVASLAEDRSLLDEALEIWTRLGDEEGIAKALWGLAEHGAYAGDYVAAEDAATRALAIFERRGDRFWITWSRFSRGFGRLLNGRVVDAADDVEVALREFHESRDVSGLVLVLAAISSMLLMAGRSEDGYAVGAAARRAVAETGIHIATLYPSGSVPIVDPDTTDPILRAAAERGAAWTRPEAVAVALRLAAELAAEGDRDRSVPG